MSSSLRIRLLAVMGIGRGQGSDRLGDFELPLLRRFRLTLGGKILGLALVVVVLGQVGYAAFNLDAFSRSYLETLQAKSAQLGKFLKEDIELVLGYGIPLTKLIKVEDRLGEILGATPELQFIEITDTSGYVLYYADHEHMGQVEAGTRRSATLDPKSVEELSAVGLSAADTDIELGICAGNGYQASKPAPSGESRVSAAAKQSARGATVDSTADSALTEAPDDDCPTRGLQRVGLVKLRISPDLIRQTGREILFDILTVILASLLITYELLSFFISSTIGDPLRSLASSVRVSARRWTRLRTLPQGLAPELRDLVERVNALMRRCTEMLAPLARYYPELSARASSLTDDLDRHLGDVDDLLARTPTKASSRLHDLLGELRAQLVGIRARLWDLLAALPRLDSLRHASVVSNGALQPALERTPYAYVRPFVFLFIIAYNLPTAFFPLYVDALYEPFLGLPKEVVLGLPISVFMFCFALSMLFAGSWTDAAGWYRPMLIGILLNGAGSLLTAFAQDLPELILFRATTAVGLGIGFIGLQQFVVANTTAKDRTLGLTAFLSAFFAGEIVGTVTGGMLAQRIGYTNVFLLSGAVSLVTFAVALPFFRHRSGRAEKARTNRNTLPIKHLFSALRDREFFAVIFFQAIPAKIALVGFLIYLVPLYLTSLDRLQSDIGRVIMCYALVLVFLGPPVSHLLKGMPAYRYHVFAGGALTGLTMLCFPLYSGFTGALALVLVLGLAHTLSLSSQAALVMETAAVRRLGPGVGMGVYRSWERLGNVMGPFLVAALVTAVGYEEAIAGLGGIILGSCMLYILLMPRRQERGS